ncbi:Sec7-domain-containing protein [Xylariaceae sp. FL0804]|nr:Sec7-domain-containing protein [Xylariaceae sp. FL0804]
MSSIIFVVSPLETIAASKEAQRGDKQLAQLAEKAVRAVKEGGGNDLPDPDLVFAPLQLATKIGSSQLINLALDCIQKLISSSYFSLNVTADANPEDGTERAPMVDRAIDTICDCFKGEITAVDVERHILQALLPAVLNDKIVVHGAGLLKAVRQVYNIFLLSRSTENQQAAQGTLTQMAGVVFERVKTRLHMKEARLNLGRLKHSSSNVTFDQPESGLNGNGLARDDDESPDSTMVDGASEATPSEAAHETPGKLTLKDIENRKSFDDSNLGDGPTTVTQLKAAEKSKAAPSEPLTESEETVESLDAEDEVYIRDAFLVFRSFCNLSKKVLTLEQLKDPRSQHMRSKLISLHLIRTLLNNHIAVFTSPLCTITNTKNHEQTSFLQAIKYYLCVSIAINGASADDRVFEVCCEIFWLMLKFMRAPFKQEIVVFVNEIYLALLARKKAPPSQKSYFINILTRFCGDPRGLVEMYLNYDCDPKLDNIFQSIIEDLSRFAVAPVSITSAQVQQFEEKNSNPNNGSEWQLKGMLPPPLNVRDIAPLGELEPDIPKDYVMKRAALESLVEALRSLVNWSVAGRSDLGGGISGGDTRTSADVDMRESIEPSLGDGGSRFGDSGSRFDTPNVVPSTPILEDDPAHLEKEKARKTALANAIRQFNFKPKRGIKLLIQTGFIPSDSPEDVARFLLAEKGLDKAQIGEYLGEGEPKNIETMHAFVDTMDFTKKRFVDALRQFLQSFRLPGEAQKIDRFMLKFANRYVMGNPNAFANADTAYVLSYSVIMLNTDLHSSKIAKRMTKEDFIKNNRGINDNADLPPEYLTGIYDEIASNEIVLQSEREAAAAAGTLPAQPTGFAAGLGQALSNVGRDLQKEAYVQQSEEISQRSEQLFKNLFKNQRRNAAKAGIKFIPATSFRHVGPMFDVTWMSFFSALSSQMQKAHNLEVNKLSLEGMKQATKIACLFDLATPREAFMSALKNATNLNNPQEILAKHVEALRVLLELGQTEGNYLKESWKDVLMCISQLDRLQLITGGVDEGAIPDVSKARFLPPERSSTNNSQRSTASTRQRKRSNQTARGFSMEIALESRSDEVIKSVDRIFSNTAHLDGAAIVHFARALTEVSWDEIKVSGSNDSPRTYSLQKIVEISYYNMTRVRFEWTNIWAVLGEHFNTVGCHNNTAIVYFALDSLRQLSMRFMEIEELPGFKFQKDFLKPFEHIMANSNNLTVKDMALRCLIQMIQARGENIRSGWRTMFGAFTVAARDPNEAIVNLAYENVSLVFKTRFGVVISQAAFTDLIVCLTEFSKNIKFQKKSLQAMETLKAIIPKMLKTPECPLTQSAATRASASKSTDTLSRQQSGTSVEEGFWFPILFAFHDVLMTGEDLEVRSNALNYFFEALLKYGGDFPPEFWDILWRQQLYPIFMVLRSRPEMSNALNHEELSVWLSTTMIQALRSMIVLFTHYFDALEYMLDRFLELLTLCICQENDTIARIGSNCLQQLILQNVAKFSEDHWVKIVGAFCDLFERTTAVQLFSAATINAPAALSPPPNGRGFDGVLTPTSEATSDDRSLSLNGARSGSVSGAESSPIITPQTPGGDDSLRTPMHAAAPTALEDYKPASSLQQQPIVVTAARRRFFNRIISRCVLQLLMIETVSELFSNDTVYSQIPSAELLRLMSLLKKSFLFAKRFNEDKDLRMRLWREGFMKQPPNLLKQESGSAATFIQILFRMFGDASPSRADSRPEVERALVPLCQDIVRGYLALEEESQQRNLAAWRPVVVDVLAGYAGWPERDFARHVPTFYPLVVELLGKEVSPELRAAQLAVLRRVGEVALGIDGMVTTTTAAAAAAASGGGGDDDARSGRRRASSAVSHARGEEEGEMANPAR